ncbi:heterodisulfide reductase-related iron-sulfur binding cluster [Cohnella sp. CFH 77786]|uniref:heterodisulfide reductase-related iron-sulfur binding cluster n=1 Tax=Cohnella sp. CFH 77786 TaxID=2662265 RepID=UPI002103A0B1|nr:heterodisulfide reductase-related iron-sulfur binding cluster [Cohnella sp. CFH 77786]
MAWQTANLLLFLAVTGYALYLFWKTLYHRYLYLKLGQPADFKRRGEGRLAEFLSQVFGQKKLLKDPKSGIMHVVVFYGFIILQFGALDLIVKGLTGGGHLPLPAYDVFGLLQEITVALILIAMGYAAYRRYGEKLARLKRGWKPSIVIFFIFFLMLSVVLSLGFERLWLQTEPSGYAPISSAFAALFDGIPTAAARVAFYVSWWAHLLILLSFLVYVPQSKHFHIVTAPINIWFRRREPVGKLAKLDLENEEAESFGVGKIEDFTQKQMLDFYACVECGRCTNVCPASSTGKALSPMHLITKLRDHLQEKGAAVTGKSPWVPEFAFPEGGAAMHAFNAQAPHLPEWREVNADGGAITDIRPTLAWQKATWTAVHAAPSPGAASSRAASETSVARADSTPASATSAAGVARADASPAAAAGATGAFVPAARQPQDLELIGDVLTEEEIWSCTTCRNCEDQCPVGNEHVDKIVDLRRHLVLMQGSIPHEGQRALQNIERQGNPWGLSRNDRAKWTGEIEGIPVPTARENPNFEYLLFVGSMGSYDLRSRKISRAFVRLLNEAGANFAILGNEEKNSGDTPRRMGNEMLFQQLAAENIATFRKYNVRKIVTACPHTFHTLKNEYPDFGLEGVEVLHHTQLLDRLLQQGRLIPRCEVKERIVYHDSCYLGRYNNVYDEPRNVLKAIPGVELAEMARSRENAMCCGAGGGMMWMEEKAGKRVNLARTEQALQTRPTVIGSACPYCLTMMEDGTKMKEVESSVKARDIAEILETSVFGDRPIRT